MDRRRDARATSQSQLLLVARGRPISVRSTFGSTCVSKRGELSASGLELLLERADVVAEFGLDRVESIFGHRRHDAGGVDDRSG